MFEGNFLPSSSTVLPKKRQVLDPNEYVISSDEIQEVQNPKKFKNDTHNAVDIGTSSDIMDEIQHSIPVNNNIILSSSDEENMMKHKPRIKNKKKEFKYVHPEDLARMNRVIRRPKEITKSTLRGFLPAIHVKAPLEEAAKKETQIGKVALIEDDVQFKRQSKKQSLFQHRQPLPQDSNDFIIGNIPNQRSQQMEILPPATNKRYIRHSFSIHSRNSLSRQSMNLDDLLDCISEPSILPIHSKRSPNATAASNKHIQPFIMKNGLVQGCFYKPFQIRLYPNFLLYSLKTTFDYPTIINILANMISSHIKINVLAVFGLPHLQKSNLICFLLFLKHDLLLLTKNERFLILESLFKMSMSDIPLDLVGTMVRLIIEQDHIATEQIREIIRKNFKSSAMSILINTFIKDAQAGEEFLIILLNSCTAFTLKSDLNSEFLLHWIDLISWCKPLRQNCIWSIYTKLSSFNLLVGDMQHLFVKLMNLLPPPMCHSFVKQVVQKYEKTAIFTNENIDMLYMMLVHYVDYIPTLYLNKYKNYFLIFHIFTQIGYRGKEVEDCLGNLEALQVVKIITDTLDNIRYNLYLLDLMLPKLVNLDLTFLIKMLPVDPKVTEFLVKLFRISDMNKISCLVYFQSIYKQEITPVWICKNLKIKFDFKRKSHLELFGAVFKNNEIGQLVHKYNASELYKDANKLKIADFDFEILNENAYKLICKNWDKRDKRLFYSKYRHALSTNFLEIDDEEPGNADFIKIVNIDYSSTTTLIKTMCNISEYMHEEQRYLVFTAFVNKQQNGVLALVLKSFLNLLGNAAEINYYINLMFNNENTNKQVWYLLFLIITKLPWFKLEAVAPKNKKLLQQMEFEEMPELRVDCDMALDDKLFLELTFGEIWRIQMIRKFLKKLDWTVGVGYF